MKIACMMFLHIKDMIANSFWALNNIIIHYADLGLDKKTNFCKINLKISHKILNLCVLCDLCGK